PSVRRSPVPAAALVLPVGGRGDDPLHAPGDWHAVGRDWLHSLPSSGSQHAPLARETATAPGEAFGCGGSHQHACSYGSVRSRRLPHTEDCAGRMTHGIVLQRHPMQLADMRTAAATAREEEPLVAKI